MRKNQRFTSQTVARAGLLNSLQRCHRGAVLRTVAGSRACRIELGALPRVDGRENRREIRAGCKGSCAVSLMRALDQH